MRPRRPVLIYGTGVRSRTVAVALAGLLTAAACSSGGSGHGPSTPSLTADTGRPAATGPVSCGLGAHPLWLAGPRGVRLEADAYGTGAAAAVFLHEAGGTGMCGFWPFAKWLADRQRVLVVLVNRCGYGQTRCPQDEVGDRGIADQTGPAVDWARAHGARRITLVGGSSGASDALEAGAVVPHVSAVVSLSADVTDTGADDLADARRLRVPVLFVLAPNDPYSPLDTARTLYRAAPARTKRLVVASDPRLATAHGWGLLQDPETNRFTTIATLVARWVTGE